MTTPTRKYNPGFLSDDELVASFCVRLTEFESLVEVLHQCTGSSNQHQIVIGPRGSGKTTLLLRVAVQARRYPLATHYFPIVFAEESYEISSTGEFWLECLTQLATQMPRQEEDTTDLDRTVDELRAIRDDQTLGDHCLAALLDFANRHKKRLLLLVENLNMLFRDMPDANAGWRMRKILQTEPQIIMFASATSRFQEIDHPEHALYELFTTRTLRPLDTRQCQTLWKAVTGRCPASRTIRSLEILTGGSPRLLAIMAQFGSTRSFRQLMKDLLALIDDHTEYFRSHLDSLAPQERRVYLALATLWQPSTTREIANQARLDTNTCSAQLLRLRERGVVYVTGGSPRRKHYYLTQRLYNIYYLLRRHRRESDRLVEALIHFMEAYYSPDELKEITDYGLLEGPADKDDDLMQLIYQRVRSQLLTSPALTSHHDPKPPTERTSHSAPAEHSASALLERVNALADDRPEDALALCEEIVHRFRESEDPAVLQTVARALVKKGSAFLTLERPQDALDVYEQVVERFGESEMPVVGTAVAYKAITLIALGRAQEALDVCEQVMESVSGSDTTESQEAVATALVGRGAALEALGRSEEALEVLDRVVARFGESDIQDIVALVAVALGVKGTTLHALGRPEEALEVFDQVLESFGESQAPDIGPIVASAIVGKGTTLQSLDRPAEALDAFNLVVERFGEHPTRTLLQSVVTAFLGRGAALAALGRPQDALEAYGEVVERFGESEMAADLHWLTVAAYVEKACALQTLERPQEALEVFDQVVERFGESERPEILQFIAKALVSKGAAQDALGRPADALYAYDAVIERFGESEWPEVLHWVAAALVSKGVALRALDRPEEALEVFDGIVERFGEREEPGVLQTLMSALVYKVIILSTSGRHEETLGACNQTIDWVVKSKGEVAQANTLVIAILLTRARAAMAMGERRASEYDVQNALVFIGKGAHLSAGSLMNLMELSVDLGPGCMKELIQESASAHRLLPLTTALEWELGNKPRVAQEVADVARDIREQLERLKRRARLKPTI